MTNVHYDFQNFNHQYDIIIGWPGLTVIDAPLPCHSLSLFTDGENPSDLPFTQLSAVVGSFARKVSVPICTKSNMQLILAANKQTLNNEGFLCQKTSYGCEMKLAL